MIWLVLAQIFLISDWAASSGFSEVPDGAIALTPQIYLFAVTAVTLVGLAVGAIELLFINRLFARRSFAEKLVGKTLFYLVLLTAIVTAVFPVAAAMEMGVPLTDRRVWARLGQFLSSTTGLSTGIQLATQLVVSLFYAEISEHMGTQVFMNFLSGRYHTPKAERRIFLFSDMKASTTISEKLGHATYFDFLREYYDTLSDAIVNHGAEVYQYIGDEIVLSWPEELGLDDGQCIRCVLRMKADMGARGPWFQERFGIAPDFRAGLQAGDVTTGEVGALKKEIVFTGDVLNQTARIQSLCKELGADVIVGDELRKRLTEGDGWRFRPLGDHVLRGKEQRVELFALEDPKPSTADPSAN